jgi:hypothetical protein
MKSKEPYRYNSRLDLEELGYSAKMNALLKSGFTPEQADAIIDVILFSFMENNLEPEIDDVTEESL